MEHHPPLVIVRFQLILKGPCFIFPDESCFGNFQKSGISFIVVLSLPYDALVPQEIFKLLHLVFMQQPIVIYSLQLFVQFKIRRGLMQSLRIYGIRHPVFEIIGASEIIQFFVREVEFAAQYPEAL